VAIYTIALPGATIPQVKSESPEFVLAQLARQTGGRSFHPEKPSQLDGIYRQIKSDLASQYLFGYRSDRHDGRFHQITVQVGRHGLAARTRLGYFADNR
jgi:VWFA-related protein